jgi:lipooligosaccharide transport system ATP-binding protein
VGQGRSRHSSPPASRVTGETAFCYLTESRPLLRHLADRHGLRYLHRPANLEDVFLKLTGRDLRD